MHAITAAPDWAAPTLFAFSKEHSMITNDPTQSQSQSTGGDLDENFNWHRIRRLNRKA